jgi:hypothetical protein
MIILGAIVPELNEAQFMGELALTVSPFFLD